MSSLGIIIAAIIFACILGYMYLHKLVSEELEKHNKIKLKYPSSLYIATLMYTEGLPFARGAIIELVYLRDKIIFKNEHEEVTLDINKIVNIGFATPKDIKKQISTLGLISACVMGLISAYVFALISGFIFGLSGAIGGGVVGAIIGGIAGAIGGPILFISPELVITYKKDEEMKYIILDVGSSEKECKSIQEHFLANNPRETEITEL